MPRTESTVIIKRPVQDVFAFVENPANDRLWRNGMVEAEITSEGPIGIGTTGREAYRLLGRRSETTWEITEYVPNGRVAYRSTSGPVKYRGEFTYEAVDEGTRVTFVLEWEQVDRGFYRGLTDRLLKLISAGTNEGELANLKRLLDS